MNADTLDRLPTYWATPHTETLAELAPVILQDPEALDLHPVGTGGGCEALQRVFSSGHILMVTDSDAGLPKADELMVIGLYFPGGDEVAWLATLRPSHVGRPTVEWDAYPHPCVRGHTWTWSADGAGDEMECENCGKEREATATEREDYADLMRELGGTLALEWAVSRLPFPRDVGATEYSTVHELITDLADSGGEPDIALASLSELQYWARTTAAELRNILHLDAPENDR